MPEPLRVAVIGGGIAGLSAAYYLTRHHENIPLRITLIEADGRLGGKISTEPFADMPLDRGPDAFLARVPWVTKLCRELGLEHELIAPATGKTWIWTRGRLRELPEGLVFGIPTRIWPIARSGILSPWGVMRAGLDLALPRTNLPEDPSVAQVIGSRFGSEAVERLVEPLLGGIHAGRADRLSLAAVAPHLVAATQKYRSLIMGLGKQRTPANTSDAACSWSTNEWPELRQSGLIILRCSTGRLGDDRPMKLDDDELVKRLHNELVEAMGVQAYPVKTRVARWERSFAQYEPGHKARIARVEAKLAELPGIILAGSAYHGSGLAACVHDGELAATQMQTYLRTAGQPQGLPLLPHLFP